MRQESKQENKFDTAPFSGSLNKMEKDAMNGGKAPHYESKFRLFTFLSNLRVRLN